MESVGCQLAEFLKIRAMGKSNAVRGYKISELFGLKGSELRNCVNQLRQDGVPICSGYVGYYYAETKEEILETVENLRGRVAGVMVAVEGLELSYICWDEVDESPN